MKIKLDEYTANIIIKALYNYRTYFDEDSFKNINKLTLYLIDKTKSTPTNRKKKIVISENEIKLIEKCLIKWRNDEIKKNNENSVFVIGEILAELLS